jgi:hypothetical protein
MSNHFAGASTTWPEPSINKHCIAVHDSGVTVPWRRTLVRSGGCAEPPPSPGGDGVRDHVVGDGGTICSTEKDDLSINGGRTVSLTGVQLGTVDRERRKKNRENG